ncbi:MAG: MATE family efflux transporter [Thermanaeromonas sp.]|uniref:MATE family efflux transporter n=1 Tax=Thermanaeromonas sp. TaxID=2003697 RepID=UPI0024396909|nr:MATE family efflux transporter [Thermanaeromonas sp.]MCG0279036.1 MATE family efflux transporter [Thermanaeromonas sp.]
MDERPRELGYAPVGRLLWHFSWPAIVGMTCNALYNVVDRAFVGHGVGPLAIAATTVAFPVMIILMALSVLVGVGTTALISIRLGEQKKEEAELAAANGTALLFLLPLSFAVVYFLFPEPILRLFGATDEVMPYARDFMDIIMLGAPFGSLGMGMNNFIRAEGNPLMAMSTQVFGALLNGILNYVFIFHLKMGIKGSALATVTGQVFASLWVLSYYFTGRSLVKLKLKNFALRLPVILNITAIGFAPFAMQMANSLQQVILNKTVLRYSGDLGLSAVGIMMSIAGLLLMPILGISQGAQPIIGFNYGARQYSRVIDALKKAVIAASCVSVTGYLALRLWPSQIAALFTEGEPELIDTTAQAMRTFFAMIFVIGFQVICSNYFQAVGKAKQAAVLSLSRQVLLFIPLLLILPHFWGIKGVWRTPPIADALSSAITACFILREVKLLSAKKQLAGTQMATVQLNPSRHLNRY